MNCFHFSVSLGYKTTSWLKSLFRLQLWIAFIFQYLWDTKQLKRKTSISYHRCELLSFFSIFGIQNNCITFPSICQIVVNCFHFSVSLGYKTTILVFPKMLYLLWIAFIFQYLWDTKQQSIVTFIFIMSCELLSFFSIFGIQNNEKAGEVLAEFVVNCFHFSVSLGYKTTFLSCSPVNCVLWIAFIFQYLWDTKQLIGGESPFKPCCELLSFFSIFGIQNNGFWLKKLNLLVVNCFHFSVSLGYKTTRRLNGLMIAVLWIAFIFQYLWDTKQLFLFRFRPCQGCELLSFFSIFGIQNNIGTTFIVEEIVVNCFHFSVSLGYKTTIFTDIRYSSLLWIAFIFQYLWDTKQPYH